MVKLRKLISMICICVIVTMLFAVTAAASTKLNTISIGFRETAPDEAGYVYDVEVVYVSNGYEITDVSFSSDQSEWKPGKKVTCTIELRTKDGYIFSRDMAKSDISASALEIVSVESSSSKCVVKGNYIPKVKLAVPENLYYDEGEDGGNMVARWDKVENCKAYEVQLIWEEYYEYTNSDGDSEERVTQRTKNVTVTTNSIDFSSYVTVPDSEVTFKVRAIPSSDAAKKYMLASDWVDFDGVVYADGENSTYGQFVTTDQSITFRGMDGELASGWQIINGIWYYFDPNNGNKAILNNWGFVNGNWYHFDNEGKMQSGWQFVNNRWYYMEANLESPVYGAMKKGWYEDGPGGAWYYLTEVGTTENPEGSMLFNCVTPDGYTVGENGMWVQ